MLTRIIAFVAVLLAAPAVSAQETTVSDAWARATPAGASAAAAYLTVVSPGGDRLVAVSTPVAKEAGLHTMTMDGAVMRMRPVAGVDLPPGVPVTLKPEALHIMLTGLSGPLKAGQSFPLTLTFAKAGVRSISVTVAGFGAMGPPAPSR